MTTTLEDPVSAQTVTRVPRTTEASYVDGATIGLTGGKPLA
jgi:hypothetical protein